MPSPLNMVNAASSHTAPLQAPASVQLQTPTVNPHAIMYPGAFSHAMPQPQPTNPLMHSYPSGPPPRTPAITTANPGVSQMTYGGFMQTHQVKNVQVFTGNADSKILVDDWTRDMQYLLEAIELPTHLRFSTVVRHLSGEARKLVLNLPPHEQTPEKAFEELRAEYGDTQGSLDPLADFYECSQRPGESACSYAIVLESTLRAVEENQRGGRPFPDRDSKLTRQFLRGLNDEEVYARIVPMKPRLFSFRELQVELRNLARETKKFQSQHKSKKTYAQVHVASESSALVKTERTKHASELSELTEMVRKLTLSQQEHMAKLSHLEARITAPVPIPPPRPQPPPVNPIPSASVTCYRCGKQGHIARVCREVFPNPNPAWAQQPQPVSPAEVNTPGSSRPLKRLEPMVAGETMGGQQGPLLQKEETSDGVKGPPLVGPRNEGEVEVNGIKCRALIDSGSQVTTVTDTYWRNHPILREQKLQSSKVPIEGAGGQKVLHRGVLCIELKVMGKEYKTVPAFVVPDSEYRSTVPLLVGTNVTRAVKSHLQATYGQQFLHQVKESHPEWYTALLEVGDTKQSEGDDTVGPVVYTGRKICIPGGKEMDLMCKIKAGPQRKTYTALIEGHPSLQLPQDLLVAKVLADVKRGCAPVRVMNLSQRAIIIKPHTQLANAFLVDNVVEFPDKKQGDGESEGDNGACLSFDQVVAGCAVDLSEAAVENEHQRSLLRELVEKNAGVFSQNPTDYGHTKTVQHEIPLVDSKPFRLPYRKIPPSQWQDVRRLLSEMVDAGVIRPSKSPYASPVVIVTKKDGSLRLCIDYRKLNSCGTRDAFPLPRIEEALEALGQAKYFSTLDLTSGYWQVEVAEQDRHKTAFSTPMGLFEANRMPFGLQNAPSTFQRLMTCCFGDLNFTHLLIYLDDLIIFSKTFDEHLERLQLVFDRLREHGLKLKPSKCWLVREEVQYLGHLVSAEGVRTDPEKISRVKEWARPTNRREVLQFLGFAGYYRRYVQGYSALAAPLYRLTSGDPRKKKRGGKRSVDPDPPFLWTNECEEAFQSLKRKLMTAPVLGYPDYSLPFLLQTDASGGGLGAVLAQVQDGAERVIAYASRGLSPAETRYPAHKLEFLALKWAVTDKFYDHLYGRKFSVQTDNNPLKYVMTSAKLDATGQRWVSRLSAFDFDIQYRRGQSNSNADALSRLSTQEVTQVLQTCPQRVTSEQWETQTMPEPESPPGEGAAASTEPVPSQLPEASEPYGDVGTESLPAMTRQEIRTAQKGDPVIGPVLHFRSRNQKPCRSERVGGGEQVCLLLKEWRRLTVKDGIMYRCIQDCQRGAVEQLLLPENLRTAVKTALHDDSGHLGFERTLQMIRERFYWPRMFQEIKAWCEQCERCCLRKTPTANLRAPLVSIHSSTPMELVCVDFLTLEKSKGGIENVLIVTDHFSRYAQAYPTKDQKARTVAKVLWRNYFCRFGFPAKLHADQGRNFESAVVKELCKCTGITKTHTTPYHPQGNGTTERFNRTLLNMLGTLEPHLKPRWHEHLDAMTHAYNCTRHDSTGFTPHYLMFGRHPRLPVDLIFGLPTKNEPVEQGGGAVGEEALDVREAGTESDTAEDWMTEDAEENVGRTRAGRTNRQDEHTSTENMDMDAGQMSGGETSGAVVGDNTPQGPSFPRRNPPRNRRLPQKLSCEAQVIKSEGDQEKIRRGWKLWQRVKARRAAGHV
ncbi:uncharacterized protein LOC134878197 [Eleginops maclovinus]|uniref:uncharacterized protein LOC134878197 n=1 Tax=Eleginops maclovinus TaxID=56733 RepID=UPI00307FE261